MRDYFSGDALAFVVNADVNQHDMDIVSFNVIVIAVDAFAVKFWIEEWYIIVLRFLNDCSKGNND